MLIKVLLLKATVNLGEVKCYSFAFSAKYLQPVITEATNSLASLLWAAQADCKVQFIKALLKTDVLWKLKSVESLPTIFHQAD